MAITEAVEARALEAAKDATSHVFYVAGLNVADRRVYLEAIAYSLTAKDAFTASLRHARRFASIAELNRVSSAWPALQDLSVWTVQCVEQVR